MSFSSQFLNLPPDAWLASNDLAFAVPDGFPVAPGHALVLTKRLVPTWFDATPAEQAAMMALVNEVRDLLLRTLRPVPDGFNVGFNAGPAAGQTVPHVHIHVIPRYTGDCPARCPQAPSWSGGSWSRPTPPRPATRTACGNRQARRHARVVPPKAWRVASRAGGMLAIGSSNLSRTALQNAIEWNIVADVPAITLSRRTAVRAQSLYPPCTSSDLSGKSAEF